MSRSTPATQRSSARTRSRRASSRTLKARCKQRGSSRLKGLVRRSKAEGDRREIRTRIDGAGDRVMQAYLRFARLLVEGASSAESHC